MLDDIPRFTAVDFEQMITGSEDEYVAFVYDAEGTPSGTLVGFDAASMTRELKENTHSLNYRYVLCKVVENYMGQTFH
jgi:hypothetical protein